MVITDLKIKCLDPIIRLPINHLKNFNIENEGIQLLPKPLFTPEQCKIIWDEVDTYITRIDNILKDEKIELVNGHYCYNLNNWFRYNGLPSIAFIVMYEMVKRLSKDIFNTNQSNIICCLEPFYFKKADSYTKGKQKTLVDIISDTKHVPILHSFVQITPGTPNKNCFIAKPRTFKDACISFDNPEIPPGQIILYTSDIINGMRTNLKSDCLIFSVTCLQTTNTKSTVPYNIASHDNINWISTAYLINRLNKTNYALIKKSKYNEKYIHMTKYQRKKYEKQLHVMPYPTLDTEEMLNMLGFINSIDYNYKKKYTECHNIKKQYLIPNVNDLHTLREKLYNQNNINQNINNSHVYGDTNILNSINPDEYNINTNIILSKDNVIQVPPNTISIHLPNTTNLSETIIHTISVPCKKRVAEENIDIQYKVPYKKQCITYDTI